MRPGTRERKWCPLLPAAGRRNRSRHLPTADHSRQRHRGARDAPRACQTNPDGHDGGSARVWLVMTSVDSPVNRDYVRYLQAKLVAAESGLLEMSQNYGDAKARFDRMCADRGITPDADIVS